MMRARNPEFAELESRAGIFLPGAMDWLPRFEKQPSAADASVWGAFDERKIGAMDAAPAAGGGFTTQSSLITAPNAGIPAYLTTYYDPKVIEVLLQPVKAAEIYGETKKGDWLLESAAFPMVEYTGYVSSYGDYSENGRSGANAQWEWRQSYLYQTFTFWGERETERMGLARLDWVSRLNMSSANNLLRFQNLSYFYGIANLQAYGGLNDPSLSAALTPATKAAGGTSWSVALPTEILADVQKMVATLVTQTGSNIDRDTRMTLVIHSQSDIYIANTNSFGLTAAEMIKKAFPNIRIVTAPQLLSGTTYSAQLFVDEINGQRSVEAAFNEKMRAHRIVPSDSSFRQKKTQGTWGTIWYRPLAQVQMASI
jgi:hypothetical protein